MNKRLFSLFCILAVVLVFAFTAQTSPIAWTVGAEDSTVSTSKKPSQEEPYVEPSTSATTATQPPMPTSTSTTKEEPSSKPEDTTKQTDPTTKPTEKPTEKPSTSEKENTSPSETASEKDTTKTPGNTTTTKKGGKNNTTTTKRGTYSTTRPVQHMTVPQVDNTTVEGTTLSPLDAYFERISGDSNTYVTETEAESQTQQAAEDEKQPLSIAAKVAICVGGIALVTVVLTAAFAIRNKRSGGDDGSDGGAYDASAYEQDAYGYDEYDTSASTPQQAARPQVDESDAFTVVSLDDTDYTD